MSKDKYGKARFLHFRAKKQDGSIDSRGGITVAYEEQVDGTVAYAAARCHENDNYNKRLGRDKSYGRLQSATWSETYVGNTKDFIEQMILDVDQHSEQYAIDLGLHSRHKESTAQAAAA